MVRSRLLGPLLCAALLAACAASSTPAPIQTRPSHIARLPGGAPAHVGVLVMENEEFSDLFGSPAAPYINSLAHHYALVRNLYAITHPSLPNYLALTGGATFGIDSDCTDCSVSASSLVDQLEQRRLSWKGYMENLPRPCFTGPEAGLYAKKHDPFAYYRRITDRPTRCRQIVPLSQLAVDERARQLPRFVWITPNLCHDMHNCDVSVGDRFLAGFVPPLLAALGPRGVLFLVWDEGSTDDGCCRLASGGHVVGVVAGGLARPGAQLRATTDHYSVLQTVEDLFGLPRLRGAACACTASLAPLLRGSAPRTAQAVSLGSSVVG